MEWCDVGKRTRVLFIGKYRDTFQFAGFWWKTKPNKFIGSHRSNRVMVCVILVYDKVKIVHPLKRSKEMSHNIILRIRFCILCISKAESIETKHNMLIDYFQMLTKFTIECTSGTVCLVWHESHPLKHIRMVCARDFAIIFRTFGTIISSFAMLSHAI